MTHMFDGDLACEVGIEKAVLLSTITYRLENHYANWTWVRAEEFIQSLLQDHPYFSGTSIRRWLRELVLDGYLRESEGPNKTPFEHAKWYALGPKLNGGVE